MFLDIFSSVYFLSFVTGTGPVCVIDGVGFKPASCQEHLTVTDLIDGVGFKPASCQEHLTVTDLIDGVDFKPASFLSGAPDCDRPN